MEAENKDADEIKIPVEDEELGAGATPGVSKTELWIRNSPFLVVIMLPRDRLLPLCRYVILLLDGRNVVSDSHLSSSWTVNWESYISLLQDFFSSTTRPKRCHIASIAAYQYNTVEFSQSHISPVAARTLQLLS